MAEFTGGNEEYISVREPIVFENKTESQYEVCAGIVFHKSGIYEVSVVGNKTIVSEVPERKPGKWVHMVGWWECDQCHAEYTDMPTCMGKAIYEYCPMCGVKMEVNE